MGDILICGRSPHDAMGERLSHALRKAAREEGAEAQDLTPFTWLAASGPRPVQVVSAGAWTLVGDVLNRRDPGLSHIADEEPWAYEKKLFARFWGRYIGVRFDGAGAVKAVLRDASGALDCVAWRQHGLDLVASDIPDWLVRRLAPPWRIDFDRVGDALRDTRLTQADLLLEGPAAVAPGAMRTLPDGDLVPLWTPGRIARRSTTVRLPDDEAAGLLRARVEEAVSGLARVSGPLIAEVSGGLDSSIVAACLAAEPEADVRQWLNSHGPDPSSDERSYVAALSRRLDINPTFAARREHRLTLDDLVRMPQRWRPALSALDTAHDADWADRLRAAGATALFTGKGGDPMFVQPVPQTVFADLLADRGWRALLDPALPALARSAEVSVWTLIAIARGRRRPLGDPPMDFHPPSLGPPPRHPWLEDLDGIGPAKTYQVANLIYALTVQGPSLRDAVVDVFNPLLAQPVVETCLSLNMAQLTLGRRDRALARRAFADRLPEAILRRRSKGEQTALYGRALAGGLDVLRPWLLEGRLAAEGLLDRAALDAHLTRESLAWRGGYGEVLTLAAFEGWVRAWEARLSC